MKTLAAILLGCLFYIQGIAQIQRIEYFIDDQVSFGEGQTIPLPAGSGTELSLSDTLRFASLAPGPHRLYLRAKDAAGKWGIVYSKQFIVPGGSATQPLDGFEYTIDSMLTVSSKAAYQKFTSGSQQVTFQDTLRFSSLSPGLHWIYLRIKNTAGFWSTPYARMFIVPGGSVSEPLDGFEFFIDSLGKTDKAIYRKFKVSASNINILDTLPIGTLKNGVHSLQLRIKNKAGFWSVPYRRSFANLNYGAPSKLSSLCFYTMDTTKAQSKLFACALPSKTMLLESNPLLLPVDQGAMLVNKKYYIHLYAIDELGHRSFVKVDSIRVKGSTNVIKQSNAGDWVVYPNPAAAEIVVMQNGKSHWPVHLQLFDIYGKTIRGYRVEAMPFIIDLRDLANGVYLLRCCDANGGVCAFKIIKQ